MILHLAASPIALGLGIPVGVVLLAGGVLVIGIRFRIPLIADSVRRMNRGFINPRQMQSAGKAGSGVAVLRHVGRNSGIQYETPIGANAVDDGFVVALTYGPRTDWLRNVQAAGSATLVVDGREIVIDRPEVLPTASILDAFSRLERLGLRLFGVSECLVLRRA